MPSLATVCAMEYAVDDVPVHYVEHGEGSTCARPARCGGRPPRGDGLPRPGARGTHRVPPDLPGPAGHGPDPRPRAISSAEDVLDVLVAFVDGVVGDRPLVVVGHSAGAFFAEAIACRRPEQVVGLALLCPLLAGIRDVPEHEVTSVRATSATPSSVTTSRCRQPRPWIDTSGTSNRCPARRPFRPRRLGERWDLTTRPQESSLPKAHPVCDRTPGLHGRLFPGLGDARAVPARHLRRPGPAGHALPHEQPDLLRALVTEWLDRVREHASR